MSGKTNWILAAFGDTGGGLTDPLGLVASGDLTAMTLQEAPGVVRRRLLHAPRPNPNRTTL